MQDEVNYQVVCLAIRGTRLGARELMNAFRKYMADAERRMEGKSQNKSQSRTSEKKTIKNGRQSLSDLKIAGDGVDSVSITEENIKSFEKTARKYDIDFALKKTRSEENPTYLVFFKVKDSHIMEKAMKDFNAELMKREKQNNGKPPYDKQINEAEKKTHEINGKEGITHKREKVLERERTIK